MKRALARILNATAGFWVWLARHPRADLALVVLLMALIVGIVVPGAALVLVWWWVALWSVGQTLIASPEGRETALLAALAVAYFSWGVNRIARALEGIGKQ